MVWTGSYDEHSESSDTWIAHAPRSADIDVEVAFLIRTAFYFGPDDDFSEENRKRFSDPIYQPALALRPNGSVLSSEALRKPDELIKYYRDVIRLGHRHEKPVCPADPPFWLRPAILELDSAVASFGWSDTFDEALGFLSSIRAGTDDQLYWNVDQGWHMEVIGRGPYVFIREGDPHYAKTFRCFGTSRTLLRERSSSTEDRVRRIKSILVEAIGANYWDYPARP